LLRTDARARRLSRALAFAPVAFIATVFRVDFFAGFRIARGRRFVFFALRRGVLRSRRRGRKQKDCANRGQNDASDHPRTPPFDPIHGWKEHDHAFPFGDIVPQDRPR
jgi:hypothetical protein